MSPKMLVLALAAIVLLPSCDKDSAKKEDLTEYVAEDGSFTVMSKIKPRTEKINVPTPAGNAPTTQYMFSAPGAQGGAIMVMVSVYPIKDKLDDKARQKVLTDARDGVVNKFKGTASDDNAFEIDGYPGRDFKFSASHPKMGEMVGRSKIVLKDNVLFQVMRMGDPKATDFIAEGDALIDSFKFKK